MRQVMNSLISSIHQYNRIKIFPHILADGDAIGSSFALAFALSKLRKDVTVVIEEPIADSYHSIPGQNFTRINPVREEVINYLSISLDCSDEDRLGKRKATFLNGEQTINIDHHLSNTNFAHINYVDTSSSATGEIIFELIGALGINLDLEIATCLFVAISTDTGNFKFSNTTSKTHKIVSELLVYPVKVAEICRKLYDETSLKKLKLLGRAINSLELYYDNQVGLMKITKDDIKTLSIRDGDFEGIINYCLNAENIEVAILVKEISENRYKVGLRSKAYIDVASIASEFNGGGHVRASGFTADGDLDRVKIMVVDRVINHFSKGGRTNERNN